MEVRKKDGREKEEVSIVLWKGERIVGYGFAEGAERGRE